MVAAVEYRDSSMACFPAQVHDSQAAVRFVADHADELSGGCSSGPSDRLPRAAPASAYARKVPGATGT
ncbi:hypothetical protein [uncultured Parolsenella sp.]|uniref:hypothetical protein n=1 Tax=uncultured Parolsenella sp. TaxID=2083008 RepID=UPI00344E2407